MKKGFHLSQHWPGQPCEPCSVPAILKWTLHISAPQDGCYPLDAEAAITAASVVAAIRGTGKPHTTPAECRSLNTAFFADLCQV